VIASIFGAACLPTPINNNNLANIKIVIHIV
jgi:hypothetical protein